MWHCIWLNIAEIGMRRTSLFLLAGLAAAAMAGTACAQTLTLQGLAQSKTLTAADFAALPHAKLAVEARGKTRTYEGLSLLELMRKVGGPWGDTLTGKQMAEVLLVTCADGYKVAYSIGEADPGTAKGQVLIADRVDGAPLDPKAGPFQIVVENDLRPARAAHMVQKVQLLELK